MSKTQPCNRNASAVVRSEWGRALRSLKVHSNFIVCFRGKTAVLSVLMISEKSISRSFVPGRNEKSSVSSEFWSLSEGSWSCPKDNSHPIQSVLGGLDFPWGMFPTEGSLNLGYDARWPCRRETPVSCHAHVSAPEWAPRPVSRTALRPLPGLCPAPPTPLTCIRGACGE